MATIPKSCGPSSAASRKVKTVAIARRPEFMTNAHLSAFANERRGRVTVPLPVMPRGVYSDHRAAAVEAAARRTPRASSCAPPRRRARRPRGPRGRVRAAPARRPEPEQREPELAPGRRPVFPEQRRLSAEEQHELVGPAARGDADLVRHDRIRRDRGPQPARPGAHRQVGVLAVHEEARVEAAELPPERARNDQQAAGDDPHLAHAVALPAADRLGVEAGASRGTPSRAWSRSTRGSRATAAPSTSRG